MKNKFNLYLFSFIAIIAASSYSFGQTPDYQTNEECTSIMVGRLASADGSVITSHTCDGVSHTWVSYEPAADHKKGETTKVYYGTRWTKFRGDTTGVRLRGEIPQARHTYAYLNTGYPCLNEKQLAIGETTFSGPDTLKNPDGMFMVEELARIALERCDNARDAVKLMGSLAEEYGYGDGGECLTVADKNEVWCFEILGNGKHSKGAVWAAQRVPDDHICVSANIPRIGKIDKAGSPGLRPLGRTGRIQVLQGIPRKLRRRTQFQGKRLLRILTAGPFPGAHLRHGRTAVLRKAR